MTDACVWELTAGRLGADRITFYADKDAANLASQQAQVEGFAIRL
jgi:hypothetical protein